MKYFKDKKISVIAVIAASTIGAGCVSTGSDVSSNPSAVERNSATSTTSQELKTYTAEPGLTPRQRFTKALEYLEFGKDGLALAELNEYLLAVPRSSSARDMIEQITTSSADYFPAEFFEVDLTSGSSLSTLAKRYLGSALKFYALAKYNNISNPSRVDIGQKIKIPLTQLAKTERQQELDDPSKDVTQYVAENSLAIAETADEMETSESLPSVDGQPTLDELAEGEMADSVADAKEMMPEVEKVTAESLTSGLMQFNQEGDFESAVSNLEQLKQFGGLDTGSREMALSAYVGRAEQLVENAPTQAAYYFSEAGQLNLIQGDDFAAFENFKKASDLDIENELAMEEMLTLQKEITDKYHREASSAFRRQELDLAIATWDKVLMVNPDHSSAQLYRAQAIELKERVEKLNSN
jgi:tetratricopeptide (TPR) repeat protein